MPNLTDDAIYLAIYLSKKDTQKRRYALLEIPTNVLPRFIVLPEKVTSKYIIFLDDIIRFGLKIYSSFLNSMRFQPILLSSQKMLNLK